MGNGIIFCFKKSQLMHPATCIYTGTSETTKPHMYKKFLIIVTVNFYRKICSHKVLKNYLLQLVLSLKLLISLKFHVHIDTFLAKIFNFMKYLISSSLFV